MPSCPLCTNPTTQHFHWDGQRDYFRCPRCDLIAVPSAQRLAPAAEKAIYDQHDNRPDDPGYRRFLGRLFGPLSERLPAGASGLDFGAGPGPTLSLMFEEAGFSMRIHDPYYHPFPQWAEAEYDFITATEVAEHLYAPGEVLASLVQRLRPGGWLGLMTKRTPDDFAGWHYIRDPTHVVFFSDASFRWLAKRLGVTLELVGSDVALLQRPAR
ncbi:class I SAM-dependent methyltransferase [Halomonas sp. DP5Y7-2]|uniref:class I SAM-dependent methyltransferase n=1 Tax=Halomonas sp. DP5Y7-2 TaxID=2859076 RepID=UPI001C998684|nr:class I SAM-dependent methyltransferase [Halomonas sp. DP5Y7-2]MBY5982560.1 class I SAM-dependent methyltransferase [Halomonas sp. DP5Y7-2]